MPTENEKAPDAEAAPGAASNAQLGPASRDAGADQREASDRIGLVTDLNDIPAVRAYLNRIGAVPSCLLTAKIEKTDGHGYPKSVGKVMFALDGQVTVSGKAEAPNESEQAAITAAFDKVQFPRMETLGAIATPPPNVRLSDRNIFVCHDMDGRIVAVRQRYEKRDGGKGFLTWTYWSDGRWRNIEPEVLPFYGTPGHRDKSTLWLHEGEKAAARVKRLQSGEESWGDFPWRPDIEFAHHVAWLGGIYAVPDSDWESLEASGWNRIVIVADNDDLGVSAARRIAKMFSGVVEIIIFDQRFPARFDLGDPWPAEQFDECKRYIGPTVRDCTVPATQATFKLPAGEDGGRREVVIRDEFADQWAFIADPLRIVRRDNPSHLMRADTFNAIIAPFSHVKDTATKLFNHLSCRHDALDYNPKFQPGTLAVDGMRKFNTYEGPPIKPAKGDVSLWLELLAHLFPVEAERADLERWIATLIARPDIRMRYGLLLISTTQGVGKNTLGNVLKIVLGRNNVSFPSEGAVVNSDFNEWAGRKRLAFISEFYSGQKRKAYDLLKSLITDDDITINEKNTNRYELPNWLTVIACSNSEQALHLDDEDRRWLVPTVAEGLKPKQFWEEFYGWIYSDGPHAILYWAHEYVAGGNHVRTTDRAPDSARKRRIVDDSRSEGKRLAFALGEHLVSLDTRAAVRLADVKEWVARKRKLTKPDGSADISHRHMEGGNTLTAMLKKVPGITVWADKKRPKFGVMNDTVFFNFDPGADAIWADVKEHYVQPEDIEPY